MEFTLRLTSALLLVMAIATMACRKERGRSAPVQGLWSSTRIDLTRSGPGPDAFHMEVDGIAVCAGDELTNSLLLPQENMRQLPRERIRQADSAVIFYSGSFLDEIRMKLINDLGRERSAVGKRTHFVDCSDFSPEHAHVIFMRTVGGVPQYKLDGQFFHNMKALAKAVQNNKICLLAFVSSESGRPEKPLEAELKSAGVKVLIPSLEATRRIYSVPEL